MGEKVAGKQVEFFGLKDVAQKLNLTQQQVAERVGRHVDWVARIWRGDNAPSWGSACRIARALGVPIGVFMDHDPARERWFARAEPEVSPPPPQPKRKECGPRRRPAPK